MPLHARIAALVLGLGLALAPGLARADRSAAVADFNQGKQYQAAKQWRPAIQAYSAALKADPSFYYAYKALGTVYYQAGDHRGALSYYHLYLKSAPNDTATQAFAAKISAELGGGGPAPAAPAVQPAHATPEAEHGSSPGSKLTSGFDVTLFGGAAMASGDDITSDFAGFSPPGVPDIKGGSCIAALGGAEVGYGLGMGAAISLGVLVGPDRSTPLTGQPGFSGTADISSIGGILTPEWRFLVLPYLVLEPRVGVGFLSESIQFKSNAGNSDTFTGSGYAIWPELRTEYLLGNWGLGLDLGYFTSSVSPITDSSTNKPFLKADGSKMSVDTSGPTFAVFVTYHIDPLVQ